MEKKVLRSRSWAFTCWKPELEEHIKTVECRYLVFGKEISPETQKLHLQGYIYFDTQRTMESVKKKFKDASLHLEIPFASSESNIAYCKKDGDFFEVGVAPTQGKRTDLNQVKDEILAGKKVDEIVLEDPILFHQYGRTLNKIEDLRMRTVYRTEMTEGYWYYGKTGKGKSHVAFQGYTPETHYVFPDDNGWWDGYAQQRVVIINDFRGSIKFSEMLQMVDKWPYSVKRRNREPMPFVSKIVIVTSSLHPKDVYYNCCERDSLEQLTRRFTITEV